jgi:hypothetical protein
MYSFLIYKSDTVNELPLHNFIFQRTQRFQNKVSRNIRNNDLHRYLLVDVVTSEIQRFAQKHERRLHQYENVEAIQLLDNMGIVHKLKKKTFELV